MDVKERELKRCLTILNDAENTSAIHDIDNTSVFVFNKYKLKQIPSWVYEIILTCVGGTTRSHLGIVLFNELMNSISIRKFNNKPIPSNYLITPNDWVECYEDGYPLLNCDKNLLEEYEESFTQLLNETSHENVISFIHHLIKSHNEILTSYVLHSKRKNYSR